MIKRAIFSAILFYLTAVSIATAADEVRLGATMPTQENLRARRGVVGNGPIIAPATTPSWDWRTVALQDDQFYVGGRLGVGTANPNETLTIHGANVSLGIGDDNNTITNPTPGIQFLDSGVKHVGFRFAGSQLIYEDASATHLPSTWYGSTTANFVLRNGKMGVSTGTATPAETLEVNGGVKVGYRADAGASAGTIRWNGTNFQGWTGAQWVQLGMKTYDSGWFYVTNNYSKTLTHNLGSIPKLAWIWFSDNSSGDQARLLGYIASGGSYTWQGISLYNVTTTTCDMIAGNDFVYGWDGGVHGPGGDRPWPYYTDTAGYCRVVLAV